MKSDRGLPQPLLRTPEDQLNEVERIKLTHGLAGNLYQDLRDGARSDVQAETETLAKSHGIYLEYNRARTGREKDWMYMIRITVPGGGAFNRRQWQILDDLATRFTADDQGRPSIRLTTRQNIQFHWVRKEHLVEVVRTIASTGFYTLNGCGDNTRNVMACPLSRFSTVCNAHELAVATARYFQLDPTPHIQVFEIDTSSDRASVEARGERFAYAPNLLNRKFKIGFATAHLNLLTGEIERDNCVEMRTNDMGAAPIIENGRTVAWQLYIGGGQGEKNGKATFATLSKPLGIFTPAELRKGMDAVVRVHQEWGDRKNRHWARLKYVVHAQGMQWFQEQVRALGASFEPPDESLDVGPRRLHHGWSDLPDGRAALGLFIECGRLIDRGEERLKSMTRHVMDRFDLELMITPNQDLLFVNVDPSARNELEETIRSFGHGRRGGRAYSRLRVLSGACVGLPTCRLSYTESERFVPELIDELEAMGYGDCAESIGVTGCERQCFRPATKSIGWVGQGPDMYMLKIGGSEDGRHQGLPLNVDGALYLRQVPRAKVAIVTAALLELFRSQRQPGETDLGAFLRRIGRRAVLEYLRGLPATTELTQKTAPAPYEPPELAAAF
ncbi:MAG: nitrite/sulfite reductase [Phycisphaerae bacterium]|nr:nitrite/sulfite reductase [Phycisphaerae bacterium]